MSILDNCVYNFIYAVANYFQKDLTFYWIEFDDTYYSVELNIEPVRNIALYIHIKKMFNMKPSEYTLRSMQVAYEEDNYTDIIEVIYYANEVMKRNRQEVGWVCRDETVVPVFPINFGDSNSIIFRTPNLDIDEYLSDVTTFHTHGYNSLPSMKDLLAERNGPYKYQYISGSVLVRYKILGKTTVNLYDEEDEIAWSYVKDERYSKAIHELRTNSQLEVEFYSMSRTYDGGELMALNDMDDDGDTLSFESEDSDTLSLDSDDDDTSDA